MGKFQAMHKYFAVVFTLVACNDSLLTQGRNIKPLNTDTTLLTSPIIPKYEVASFVYSKTDINAFRPTSPGDSPGIGHKYAEEMKEMVVIQSPDVRVHVNEGTKNDFKPTDPGHSPGVGHAFQNRNGQN
ncbi:hypothetical protein Lal_00008594 [Lupinus albus]|uniref:Putative encoded peptide n=1 Tax=Lupinus albus TaxID=3870 RepID=A0A6A5MJF8_LUPAL|nr:putative encoded peptide [Lupinus albus]KAF1874386.1 hypothetical protein Lal_00008594 [Lupinus albus]